MPNWCYTEYQIIGSKSDIDKLDNAIERLKNLKEPYVENGFGNLWLGCLVTWFGGNWKEVYCRGEIEDYQRNGDESIFIKTCTAWGEMREWRHFIEKQLPSVKMWYSSEEDGMCEYYTNDSEHIYFPRFRMEIKSEIEEFNSIDEAIEWCHEEGYTDVRTKEDVIELIDRLYEEDDDYCYEFVEFMVVDD